ncbi:MAG: esterase family protein [Clostridiales bacterium]|nr:esterase family protein [Clostridiales bacterium]
MASFKGEIKSAALDMDIALNVILPYDHPHDYLQNPCKVLYLLHGQSSSSASWMRWTSIERYAMKHGFAVIMPEVQRSFYRNMAYGLDYFTFVADELPELCQQMFHISSHREDTFIAGLSMGGYGALKIGLLRPENYAGIGSFSGAVDLQRIFDKMRPHQSPRAIDEMIGIFGPELTLQPEDDILYLTREHARLSPEMQCKLFISCGTEDEMPTLYDGNVDYVRLLEELGLPHRYFQQSGMHEWGVWDEAVQKALDYFDTER